MTPAEREARKALQSLYIAVSSDVADYINEKVDAALREAVEAERRACSELAQKHGDFCDREVRNGGSRDLFERAKGAWHIARTIEARKEG